MSEVLGHQNQNSECFQGGNLGRKQTGIRVALDFRFASLKHLKKKKKEQCFQSENGPGLRIL